MSEIHRISCGNVNCYIVSDGNSAILVDTGTEHYKNKVLKACKAYPIRLIVLTHGHMDHCQNAAFLSEALQVPVAIHEKDKNLIPDNMRQPLFAKTLLGKMILILSQKSFEMAPFVEFIPTVYLKSGDSLKEYGINTSIVEFPGHTDGSIGLDVDGDKLIVGDALMNILHPTISRLYNNREQMLASAKRISELGNRKIYFGHGRPLQNRRWVRESFSL